MPRYHSAVIKQTGAPKQNSWQNTMQRRQMKELLRDLLWSTVYWRLINIIQIEFDTSVHSYPRAVQYTSATWCPGATSCPLVVFELKFWKKDLNKLLYTRSALYWQRLCSIPKNSYKLFWRQSGQFEVTVGTGRYFFADEKIDNLLKKDFLLSFKL